MEADEMEDDPFDMVQEILNSDHYTSGEKECVKFHLGMLDGFSENLWEAIVQADDENLARLAKGFPEDRGVILLEARRVWSSIEG